MLNHFSHHMEASARASPVSNSFLSFFLKTMEWSWKQSLSSHIWMPAWITTLTALLMRLSYMSQSMSLLSPLYQAASSPQAKQSYIVLQVTHCVSLSHQLSCDSMWILHLFFFLPGWLEESRRLQQGQPENYWCCSRALVHDHLSEHITFYL